MNEELVINEPLAKVCKFFVKHSFNFIYIFAFKKKSFHHQHMKMQCYFSELEEFLYILRNES